MAKDLDENVALWCAAIEVERAHNADDRRVWEQILRQLTAAVAVLVLTLGTMPWQAIAAGKPLISKGEYTLCEIMKRSLRRVWAILTMLTKDGGRYGNPPAVLA